MIVRKKADLPSEIQIFDSFSEQSRALLGGSLHKDPRVYELIQEVRNQMEDFADTMLLEVEDLAVEIAQDWQDNPDN